MVNLEDLGFLKGTIGETIVSTYNVNSQPNAAPMGIVMKNNNQVIIRPFITSLTYKNMQTRKCAVVNLTSNPELFYLTALKETNPDGKLSPDLFEKAEAVDAPRIRAVDSTIEVRVTETDSFSSERAEFLCDVKLVKSSKKIPNVYCRAQFATIEAIIHATRIRHLFKGCRQKQKQAIKLLELVNLCAEVVDHTAPDSRYFEILADLIQRIHLWRKKSESLR